MSDELDSLRAIDAILAGHEADEIRRMLGWLTDRHLGGAAGGPREGSTRGTTGGTTGGFSRAPFAGPSVEPFATPAVEHAVGAGTVRSGEPEIETDTRTGNGSSDEPGVATFDMTAAAGGTSAVVPVGIADVDFTPDGQPAAKGYNDVWGSPDDDRVKCLEAVHWFEAVGEVTAVTPEHVHAYFVEKGWDVPDDLADAIRRADGKGYLKADDPADIRVAPKGQRLMASSLSYADP